MDISSKPVVNEIIINVQNRPINTKEMLPKFLRKS